MDPAKERLVEALRSGGAELVAAAGQLSDGDLAAGRYENGWTGREILAHVAAIEWTYPRLLEAAAAPPPPTGEPRTRPIRDGMDAYNARQVARRAATPVEELLEEFRRNRAATIAAVEAADEALLAVRVRSAGGREGTLAQVLEEVTVGHVRGHLRDILGK